MALYSTSARAEGGRNGHSETTDGAFKVDLALPKELGGNGKGNNPEQLFAAGYAACFDSATGFALGVAIEVEITGLDQAAANDLVAQAHAVCPYSNAVKGNIDIKPVVKVK